jgi:hypothetical protein
MPRVPSVAEPEILLVAFSAELTEPDMARLRDAYGLALDRFVPGLSYVERVAAPQADGLRSDFLVTSAQPLAAERKLSPALDGADADALFSATVFRGADPAAVATAVTAAGGRDVRVLDDREIGGDARVQFALDDRKTPLWDAGLTGKDQVIAVLDEGPVDLRHCFFADDPNTPGQRKVLEHRGLTLAGGAAAPLDDHAIFVAGIAAGDQLGNSGKHPDRGGAWAAKLVLGTFADIHANGLLRELELSAKAGAVIHNNSWSDSTTPRGRYGQRQLDTDIFMRANEDHLVLGGTGNWPDPTSLPAPGTGVLGGPGIAKNALCVQAARAAPDQLSLGDGNPGPTPDGRRKPDLVAVGEMRSSQKNTPCGTVPLPCATSMAIPNAAAGAALVRQYFTEGWYPTGVRASQRAMAPTGALLKAVLLNATVEMTGPVGGTGYPNAYEGWGLIRLNRTLRFPGSSRSLVVWDVRHASGIAHGETGAHSLKVGARGEQLKITMVFSDQPPTDLASGTPVVNNLDLTVTAPDGSVYAGNNLTPKGISISGGAFADDVNTVEMVIVDNPPLGTWTIRVHASVHTFDRQGYAIVASGGSLAPLVKAKP